MKLGLGTVQLGLDYGIANITGKPDKEAALRILSYAHENSISFFDTAAAYGDSEKLIGEFTADRAVKDIKICTKGKAGYNENVPRDAEGLEHRIIGEVEKSLMNLRTNKIDYYLLHAAAALERNGGLLAPVFGRLKKAGLIGKFGVSVYNAAEIRLCLEYDVIDIIQLPFNILDTRLSEAGLLEEMNRRGIEIHARSIYLQGALLMDSNNQNARIPGLVGYAEKLRVFAESLNLSVKQLAFLFVRGNRYIDGMIVGCESLVQLDENIRLFNADGIDIERVSGFVRNEFSGISEEILNPALWKLCQAPVEDHRKDGSAEGRRRNV